MATTTTSPAPQRIAFAVASCQYPGGLLDRATSPLRRMPLRPMDDGIAHRSMSRLATRLEQHVVDFVLLAGDQVYVDATAGLFDPATLDDGIRNAYAALRHDRSFTRLVTDHSVFAMLDDHELGDNWQPDRPAGPSPSLVDRLRKGAQEYLDKWPRPGSIGTTHTYKAGDRLWLDFEFPEGGFRFFMADTRTGRGYRSVANLGQASIVGDGQWRALKAWVEQAPHDRPSFLLSPSIVLPRRLSTRDDARGAGSSQTNRGGHTAAGALTALRSDAWDGYPASLHALLVLLLEVGNDKLVLLSGDEHLSCVARITLSRAHRPHHKVVVHSIHSSALYAPYPFANSIPEDFAGVEDFPIYEADSRRHDNPARCEVDTWFPPGGDGFAMISAEQERGGWTLRVCFDRHGRCEGRAYRL